MKVLNTLVELGWNVELRPEYIAEFKRSLILVYGPRDFLPNNSKHNASIIALSS
jgi:hypothetical protein